MVEERVGVGPELLEFLSRIKDRQPKIDWEGAMRSENPEGKLYCLLLEGVSIGRYVNIPDRMLFIRGRTPIEAQEKAIELYRKLKEEAKPQVGLSMMGLIGFDDGHFTPEKLLNRLAKEHPVP